MSDVTPTRERLHLPTVQRTAFLLLHAGVSLVFLWLVGDFFQPVFWAAVLAVLFRPVYRQIHVGLRGYGTLSSVLTILVVLVLVVLPLALLGAQVTDQAVRLYGRISSGEVDIRVYIERAQDALPMANDLTDRLGIDLDRVQQELSDAALAASRYLASQALNIGGNAMRIALYFFLMFYLLFFFLRDGHRLVRSIMRALPLGAGRQLELARRFAEVARATVKGTIVVAIVQGTLGGVLFWALGIPGAVFWGVIMIFTSILPAVGPGIVWVPAALIFFLSGQIARGLILVAAGVLFIGLVDNLLRPFLVGRDTRMPDYLILLSTLGGLTAFGLSGFVIGPVLAALFLTLWEMFAEEYRDPAEPVTPPPVDD